MPGELYIIVTSTPTLHGSSMACARMLALQLFRRVPLRDIASHVPHAVVVYALLGLLDFGFTIIAFIYGYGESNPLLAWYQQHGLFEIMKVGSTLVIITMGFLLWPIRAVRFVIYAADLAMAIVFVYHLVFWIGNISTRAAR
jgi:hypothetical protein